MFKRIVWATDRSDHADRALAFAARLAAESGGHLDAVHGVAKFAGRRAAGDYVHLDEAATDAEIEGQIAAAAADAQVDFTCHMVSTRTGQLAERIAEVAGTVGADLIVTGCRGRSGLAGLAMGSVTQRLFQLAPCPVLAVPATASPRRELSRQPARVGARR